ncbi:DinB family protein [Streptomyces formicae]|uniref:DinB family protein n=1 Tax=Streptomyces formicae TaxID=1616117 RepID=A0ABY3WTR2_9ACTN|nr:DinB family protein [Streptomyces formicae]UNM15045.1 DinB family protein [Streptomyces formicae]
MTSSSRIRPPFVSDERTQLVGWFGMQRAIVHYKCEGLSDADAHRSVLPGSPLMTMAGIVSHLRWTEQTWFEVLFLGRPADGPQFAEWRGDGPEDLDMMVEGVPLARLLEEYERQCAVSDEIIAAHSLDEAGRHPDFTSAAASLRWMLIHMVEETARHAGHMDTIRELLDGAKGYY